MWPWRSHMPANPLPSLSISLKPYLFFCFFFFFIITWQQRIVSAGNPPMLFVDQLPAAAEIRGRAAELRPSSRANYAPSITLPPMCFWKCSSQMMTQLILCAFKNRCILESVKNMMCRSQNSPPLSCKLKLCRAWSGKVTWSHHRASVCPLFT